MVVVSFILTIGFGSNIYLLLLSIGGAVLYAHAFGRHRYRKRILSPEAGSIYAPVSGKVEALQEEGDTLRLTIRKGAFDPVEIRCPVDGCYWEGRELVLNDPGLRLSFEAKRIFRMADARMKAGEVIALMIGAGSSVMELPKALSLLIQEKSLCEAGETRICILDEIAQD